MAKRITEEDIKIINETFLVCKTYSGVAKATGFSPSTVKKYVIPNYVSEKPQIQYNIVLPSIEETIEKLKSYSALCSITEEEKENLKEIWSTILV